MELSEVQMVLIGVIATVIVYALNLLSKYFSVKLGRGWLSAIVYVIGAGLAVLWGAPIFPALPVFGGDVAVYAGLLFGYLGEVMTAVGPIVAFATLVYNALMKAVLDKLADKLRLNLFQ